MANFSSHIYVLRDAMDKIAIKLFRDFRELENLQSSHKSAYKFTQMSFQRVKEQLQYLLNKSRPEYTILSKDEDNSTKQQTEYSWIIDVICGLENLYHSIPYFCTTVAVEKTNKDGTKEIISGVTENIITKETFMVEKEKGAYVNNRRIRISSRKKLENSIITLNHPEKIKNPKNLFQKISNIKINNCTALDLAYMASGKYDGNIIFNSNKFETAVGLLLIEEAGGSIEKFDKNNLLITLANDNLMRDVIGDII